MNYVGDNTIETNSGIKFWFLEPTSDMIVIEDIAASLSKQCRYMGHTHSFYSVAEHCCHLYDFVSGTGVARSNYYDLAGTLLHDGSEAYLVDMARPIKNNLPDYKKLESTVEKAIAKKFELEYPHPLWLKELDTRILVDERKQAMNKSGQIWMVDNLVPLGVTLKFWTPPEAYYEFMSRFRECQTYLKN